MTPEQLQAQIDELEKQKESYQDEINAKEIVLQDLKFSLGKIELELIGRYEQLQRPDR